MIREGPEYNIKELMDQKKNIDRFYQSFSQLLNKIKIKDSIQKYILNVNKIQGDNERIGSEIFISTFYRLLFLKILKDWGLLLFDPIIAFKRSESLDKDLDCISFFKKRLFFDVLDKSPENKTDEIFRDMENSPYLNGSLFRETDIEKEYKNIRVSTKGLELIWELLNDFIFSKTKEKTEKTKETKPHITTKILGYIFERCLDLFDNTRRETGSYYTPSEITTFMAKETIDSYILSEINRILFKKDNKLNSIGEIRFRTDSAEIFSTFPGILKNIKICDFACGSGAFLKSCGEYLLKLWEKYYESKKWILPFWTNEDLPEGIPFKDIYDIKTHIVTKNLYGVDILSSAIEICSLQICLWLILPRDKIPDNFEFEPLPNLSLNLVVGNALMGSANLDDIDIKGPDFKEYLKNLNIFKNKRKNNTTIDTLNENLYKTKFIVYERLNNKYYNDYSNVFLEDNKIFHWNVEFFEVFSKEKKGFDIIIGNPPYIRFQNMDENLKTYYESKYPETYTANGDIYFLFYERGMKILNNKGILTLITPRYFLRSVYGEKLRYFLSKFIVNYIYDFGEHKVFQGVGIDTMIVNIAKEMESLQILNFYFLHNLSKMEKEIKNNPDLPNIIIPNLKSKVNIKKKFSKEDLNADKWIFIKDFDFNSEKSLKLEELCDIFKGLQTGKDNIFVITEDKVDKLQLEKEILKPFIKQSQIEKFNIVELENGDKKYLIYSPYQENPRIIKLTNIWSYFLSNKEDLEKRSRTFELDNKYNAHWYNWRQGDERYNKNWESRKIIGPSRYKENAYVIDEKGYYFCQDIVAIIPKEDYLKYIYYIACLLNSELFLRFIKSTCKDLKKGYFESHPKQLQDFPVVLPKDESIDKFKLLYMDKNLDEINSEISEIYEEK